MAIAVVGVASVGDGVGTGVDAVVDEVGWTWRTGEGNEC